MTVIKIIVQEHVKELIVVALTTCSGKFHNGCYSGMVAPISSIIGLLILYSKNILGLQYLAIAFIALVMGRIYIYL